MENIKNNNKNQFGIIGAVLTPIFSCLFLGLSIYFHICFYDSTHIDNEYAWVAFLPIIMFILMFIVFIFFSLFSSICGIIYPLYQLKNKELSYKFAYYICLIISILISLGVIANIVCFFVYTIK